MEIEVRKCFEMILFYLLFVGIGVDRYKYCLMSKVIHRFIRSANLDSNIHNRVANRFDPFKNTQVTLEDPVNNRTLTLIGTTNSSTTLAHRTKAAAWAAHHWHNGLQKSSISCIIFCRTVFPSLVSVELCRQKMLKTKLTPALVWYKFTPDWFIKGLIWYTKSQTKSANTPIWPNNEEIGRRNQKTGPNRFCNAK